MAKGRVRSRMELREQYDAAEARQKSQREAGSEDEDLGDLTTAAADEADAEAAPVKKKKKATTPKTRAKQKVIRKRVVWVVYDNSNKFVQQFPYPERAKAEELAERLKTEKKQTYFVQPIKEEIKEEK